jgi:signal transduction histidine kinase
MNAEEIKALVERLRYWAKDEKVEKGWVTMLEAATALAELARGVADQHEIIVTLSDQLAAKTELATLYAASLRRSEDEVDRLRRLLSEVAALKRYDPNANHGWNSSYVVLNPTKDLLERIDAAQSQTPKDNPT